MHAAKPSASLYRPCFIVNLLSNPAEKILLLNTVNFRGGLPFRDTMELGCNFMSLGNYRVIIPSHSRRLIDNLEARGFEVAEIDMSEISKTGGEICCMAQALCRKK